MDTHQIKPNDPLPKTICKSCMKRVQQHHELMVKIQKHRNVFTNNSDSSRLPISNNTGSETQRQMATDSDENMETNESTSC